MDSGKYKLLILWKGSLVLSPAKAFPILWEKSKWVFVLRLPTSLRWILSLFQLLLGVFLLCSPGWFIPCNGMVSGWADTFMGVFASTCLHYRVWKAEAQRYTENRQLGTPSMSCPKGEASCAGCDIRSLGWFPRDCLFFSEWELGFRSPITPFSISIFPLSYHQTP